MIRGLERLQLGRAAPGLAALRERLRALLGGRGGSARLRSVQVFKQDRVARLQFEGPAGMRRLVVKRLACDVAERNRRVVQRWLPAMGLEEIGPPLLASVAAPEAECVWHVYEDLGDWMLGEQTSDRDRVAAAARVIANLHARSREHPLLAECRLWGGDLGMHFYLANVRDALRAVSALRPLRVAAARSRRTLCARLVRRLQQLLAEAEQRAALSAEHAGPEVLLHGDLWRENVFVIPERGRLRVRLIDWDHAAVGPTCYDLSTFLARFAAADRAWIFECYRDAAARGGVSLPPRPALAALFETAELSRLANRLIWPALAVTDGSVDWGFETLAEVERWFEAHEPVLPGSVGRRRRSAS